MWFVKTFNLALVNRFRPIPYCWAWTDLETFLQLHISVQTTGPPWPQTGTFPSSVWVLHPPLSSILPPVSYHVLLPFHGYYIILYLLDPFQPMEDQLKCLLTLTAHCMDSHGKSVIFVHTPGSIEHKQMLTSFVQCKLMICMVHVQYWICIWIFKLVLQVLTS